MYFAYKEGARSWRVIWEHWNSGHRKRRTLTPQELSDMGLSKLLPIEEVRGRLSSFNSQAKLCDRERRKNAIEARIQSEKLIISAHLPPNIVAEFEQTVLRPKLIREEHWRTAKKAIATVSSSPKDWSFEPWHFYNWFIDHRYSLDYCHRIRRLINEWGRFYSRKHNSFWQDIASPNQHWRNKIRIANRRSLGRSRPAKRLPLDILLNKRDFLSDPYFNWLFISIAFGLRPEEMEKSLRDPQYFRLQEDDGTSWLSIFQFKLERQGHEPERCWKHIPIVEPRQVTAREILLEQEFRKPLYKTFRYLFGEGITPYSGRKEFWNYMKGRHNPYFVRRWMGHCSGGTAEEYYDDPNDLRYWKDVSNANRAKAGSLN